MDDLKTYTIPEAARVLEVPESRVRTLMKRWEIETIRKGTSARGAPTLVHAGDVHRIRESMVRGSLVPRLRIVATIGLDEEVEDVLEISGLKVKPSTHILDAISVHHPGDLPVIVMGQDAYAKEEMLARAYEGE